MSINAQEETLKRYAKFFTSYALEKGEDIDELDAWDDFQETAAYKNGGVNIYVDEREAYIEAHKLVPARSLAVKKYQQAGEIERQKRVREIQSNPAQAVSDLRYGIILEAMEQLALAGELRRAGGQANIKLAIDLKKSAQLTLEKNDATLLEYLKNANLPPPDDLGLQVFQATKGLARQSDQPADEKPEPESEPATDAANVIEVNPLETTADVSQVAARRIFNMPVGDITPTDVRPKITLRHPGRPK